MSAFNRVWNSALRGASTVNNIRAYTIFTAAAVFISAPLDGATTALGRQTGFFSKPYYGHNMLSQIGLGQNYRHVARASDYVVNAGIYYTVKAVKSMTP